MTPHVVALMCFLTGCTGGSVHPLLMEKDLLDSPDLSGTWTLELPGPKNEKQFVTLLLEQFGDSYDVDIHGSGPENNDDHAKELWQTAAWTLQLGKLRGELYGQLIPRESPTGPPLFRGIPVYVFGRVAMKQNQLDFFPLLDTGCAAVAKREKLQYMSYEVTDTYDLNIFTMPTTELQKVVVKHGNELFSRRPWVLRRVENVTPARKFANRTAGELYGVRHLTFDPQGKRLAACGIFDLRVKVWDLSNNQLLLDVREETGTVDFDPTGKRLASGCSNMITILNAATGETDSIISLRSAIAGRTLRVKYSPDGSQLAAQDSLGGVRVYDAKSGATQFHFEEGATPIFSFHPKTNDVAVIYETGDDAAARLTHSIALHDHQTGKKKSQLRFDVNQLSKPHDLDFDSTGSRLAVCGVGKRQQQGSCLVFDATLGKLQREIKGSQRPMRCVRFSRDGTRIATGSEDGSIVLWRAADGVQEAIFRGHSGVVRSLDFHPDGKMLASGGEDGIIYLWTLPSVN